MNKYYFVLLIADIPIYSGHIFAESEEMTSEIIEKDYEGKFDQYVISDQKRI